MKAGKARYIGASSMYAWEVWQGPGGRGDVTGGRASSVCAGTYLVNLIYREEEREMLPLCADQGIGVIPWSPQARGRLTRDWDYKKHSGMEDRRSLRPYVQEHDRRSR